MGHNQKIRGQTIDKTMIKPRGGQKLPSLKQALGHWVAFLMVLRERDLVNISKDK